MHCRKVENHSRQPEKRYLPPAVLSLLNRFLLHGYPSRWVFWREHAPRCLREWPTSSARQSRQSRFSQPLHPVRKELRESPGRRLPTIHLRPAPPSPDAGNIHYTVGLTARAHGRLRQILQLCRQMYRCQYPKEALSLSFSAGEQTGSLSKIIICLLL